MAERFDGLNDTLDRIRDASPTYQRGAMIACSECELPTAEVWSCGGRDYCPACWAGRALPLVVRGGLDRDAPAVRLLPLVTWGCVAVVGLAALAIIWLS